MSLRVMTFGNTKTIKGLALRVLTAIFHLAPSRISGYQVCPMASIGCAAACLYTSGRGKFGKTKAARIRKTRQFFEDRDALLDLIVKDIRAVIRKANREGLIPAFRLNGTSDIRWEYVAVQGYKNLMEMFPTVQFYDYTAIPNRRDLPPNYHLTFSRKEDNEHHALNELYAGFNVAVVFRHRLPETWHGFRVIDGTEHDVRFLDPENVVVGLLAKADAIHDTSGFVVDA